MNRREFLARAGALAATPIVLHIVGCGDDGGTTGMSTDRFTFQGTDSGHTHTAEITCTQLRGAADIQVTHRPDGNHPVAHAAFTVTANQLMTILSGGTVTIDTNDQHHHRWTISRPMGACP